MIRAPTQKSRRIAGVGVIVIAAGLVLEAWFNPPLPRLSAFVFGMVGIVSLQLAKSVREADGLEIPDDVVTKSSKIANAEAFVAVICGLCAFGTIGLESYGAPKVFQQVAAGSTVIVLAAAAGLFRVTRARFDSLMTATASPGHSGRGH